MVSNDFPSPTPAPAPAAQVCAHDVDPGDLVKKTVRLLRSVCAQHPYTLAFSGGKDSVVLHYLLKEAGANVPIVYNQTTIDPKGTTDFCKRHGAQVMRPKQTYLQLVAKKGLPTMFRRFCCAVLKERYISDYLFTGVRRDESVKRTRNYCSFEDVYEYTKKVSTLRFHPLLYYTDADIAYVINSRQLECHPLYYDEAGTFHVERRLGCQGCPLQSDRGRADYAANTRLLYQVAKRNVQYHEAHGRTSHDAYLNMVYNLFYSNHGFEKYQQTYNGLFDNDPKQFLQNYFKIQLP